MHNIPIANKNAKSIYKESYIRSQLVQHLLIYISIFDTSTIDLGNQIHRYIHLFCWTDTRLQ